jgi:plasmid stabilization system protein ParE
MKVVWSREFEKTFDEILNYIEVKFGVVTAKKFIEKTDSILKIVSG